MHYQYYYYSREQLLANRNAIPHHLVSIVCEALLIEIMMSVLCKHTHKHTGMFEGSYEIKQEGMSNLDVICCENITRLDI